MGDLKPCPFCGLKEVSEYKTYVGCNRCNADGPTTMHDNQVELWNLRHSERTPAEEAVLRAAVACRRAGSNNWAAWMDLANAVDALLRENPAWGKEEGGG